MNQKKQEEIELHLCSKLKKMPFKNRKQMDLVFKFAFLVVRNKQTGFFVIDDTLFGNFCKLASSYIKEMEKVKSLSSLDDYTKIKELIDTQKEIENLMKKSLDKMKELK